MLSEQYIHVRIWATDRSNFQRQWLSDTQGGGSGGAEAKRQHEWKSGDIKYWKVPETRFDEQRLSTKYDNLVLSLGP